MVQREGNAPLTTFTCKCCGAVDTREEPDPEVWTDDLCRSCTRRLPPSLVKATVDPFDYALRLLTGEIIYFESASIHGDYATIKGCEPGRQRHQQEAPFCRGLDVRLDAIVWCADAPHGS